MNVQKKSQETLKQQKDSFLNYIKTKEKYSWIIADLLDDEELEKIDNMEWIKDHLEQKWISKEQTDSLESDYKSYLKGQGFYGPDNEYPDEIKESIKENDKILQKIKKEILKEYKNHKDFIFLDVESLVNNEFIAWDNSLSKNIKNTFYYSNEIENKNKEKNRLNVDIKNIQEFIDLRRKQLEKKYWFQVKKKKDLKRKIEEMEQEKKNKEKEIQIIDVSIQESEKNKMMAENIERIQNREETDIRSMMRNDGKYTDITLYKQAIKTINEKLKIYFAYMPDEIITKIKANITKIIEKNRKTVEEKVKSEIETMLKEYLNYFNYWENRNLYSIKTIYSKNRVDPQIMEILNKLWIKIDIYNETIDYNFINDVFIHTTWFNVLDEILEEWWLISTNELRKRGKDPEYNDKDSKNNDIKDSTTQTHKPHRDIYFSRWYRKNGYWHHEELNDDFVFIANTMSSFANNWYWVPLNTFMQPNEWKDSINARHDTYWYSIISKTLLEKSNYTDPYSKINLEDVYIFVPETKKDEIESNPKYKTEKANIIYIPKEYIGPMDYDLYEFIKKEVTSRNKWKIKKTPIPMEIITDEGGIYSINGSYKRVFCKQIWEEPETIFNPLKGADYGTIINFLIKNSDEIWFTYLKVFNYLDIDYKKLGDFITEKKENVDELINTIKYPKELSILAIIFTKIWLWENKFNGEKQGCLAKICNKLREYWYEDKKIRILYKSIMTICDFRDNEQRIRNNKNLWTDIKIGLQKWCNDLWVDFNRIKEYIVKIADITERKYVKDLIEETLK